MDQYQDAVQNISILLYSLWFLILGSKQFRLIDEGLLLNRLCAGFDCAAVSLLWGHQPHRLVWGLQRHPRARFLLPGIQRQLWPGQPRNVVDSGKFWHAGHTGFLCSGGPTRNLLGLAPQTKPLEHFCKLGGSDDTCSILIWNEPLKSQTEETEAPEFAKKDPSNLRDTMFKLATVCRYYKAKHVTHQWHMREPIQNLVGYRGRGNLSECVKK